MTRPKKIILRTLLILGFGFVILLVALMGIILPDQVRSVPEPVVSFKYSNGADAPGEIAAGKDSATSETYPVALDALLRRDFAPCPDLSIFPAELRGAAIEWNSRTEDIMAVLRRSQFDSKESDFSEIRRHWGAILGEYYKNHRRYSLLLQDVEGFAPPDQSEWRKIAYRVFFEASVGNKQWKAAARACQFIAWERMKPNDTERDPYWWPYEMYCYRQDGFSGRLTLASITINQKIRESPGATKFLGIARSNAIRLVHFLR